MSIYPITHNLTIKRIHQAFVIRGVFEEGGGAREACDKEKKRKRDERGNTCQRGFFFFYPYGVRQNHSEGPCTSSPSLTPTCMTHQVLFEIFGLEEFLFTEVTGIGSLRVVSGPMVLYN